MTDIHRITNYLVSLKEMFPDRPVIDLIFDAQRFREPSMRQAYDTRMTDTEIADCLEFYWRAKKKDAA